MMRLWCSEAGLVLMGSGYCTAKGMHIYICSLSFLPIFWYLQSYNLGRHCPIIRHSRPDALSTTMKIAIIGAGIAGCAVYLELKKHLPRSTSSSEDHEITIYEAYDTGKDVTSEDREEGPTHSDRKSVV